MKGSKNLYVRVLDEFTRSKGSSTQGTRILTIDKPLHGSLLLYDEYLSFLLLIIDSSSYLVCHNDVGGIKEYLVLENYSPVMIGYFGKFVHTY